MKLTIFCLFFLIMNCSSEQCEQQSWVYLDRTRTWVKILSISYNSVISIEDLCMKDWDYHTDICPLNCRVFHTDPITYDIVISALKMRSIPITCIKKQICLCPPLYS